MEKQSLSTNKYVAAAGMLLLIGLYLISQRNYLLFHSLAEFFSIAVAWGIFMTLWNTRTFNENACVHFLGIAYLFISGIDLLHTLAYKGMGVFDQEDGANLASQLWISARYLESLSLLIAPSFLGRKIKNEIVFSCYAVTLILLLVPIFYWKNYPDCFLEGQGLTSFKKISEYLICLILSGSIARLFQKRSEFDPLVFRLLIASVLLTIISELTFTFYVSIYGLLNQAGHYFKIISFYLIYKAIIVTGLTKPYRLLFREIKQKSDALLESQDRFNAFMNNCPATAFLKDEQGRLLYINPAFERAFDFYDVKWKGKTDFDLWSTSTAEALRENDVAILRSGDPQSIEETILQKDGEHYWLTFRFPFNDASGQRFIGGMSVDLTERKQMGEALKASEKNYYEIFNATNEAIFIHDMETGEIIDVNRTMCEMYGYSYEEALDIGMGELSQGEPPYTEKEAIKRIRNAAEEGPQLFEWLARQKNGELLWAEVHLKRATVDGQDYVLAVVRDISERKQAQDKLKESEEKYRALVEHSPDIIARFDREERYLYISPAITAVTGTPPQAFLGRTCHESGMEENLCRLWKKNIRQVFDAGQPMRDQFEFHGIRGPAYYDWMLIPEFGKDGDVETVLTIARDVSEQMQMKEEIIRAKVQAEDANRAKSEFLANMSHEIRTPISGIIGMAEMTLGMNLNPAQQEGVELIRTSAEMLLAIINDILDFSKIEAHKLELYFEDFDLHSEMEQIIRTFTLEAEKKKLDLSFRIKPDVPKYLHGDSGRLTQVVKNLLGNAFKFTEKGIIELEISKKMRDEDALHLLFTVSDTGIGIPENKVSQLFQTFSQLDTSYAKKYGGTGLGLAISKKLVEMMGGAIRVESREGEGSVFSFTAQFRQAQNMSESLRKMECALENQNIPPISVRILLAEDNIINQKFVSHFLTQKGYEVVIASNGKEALNALEQADFDMILMDVQMPEMDGIEATKAIRDSRSCIPIIALTAYAMKGDRERFLAAGMDDYVSKPVDRNTLFEVVRRFIPRKREGDRIKTQDSEAKDPFEGVRRFSEYYCGQETLLKEIFQIFTDESALMTDALDRAFLSGDMVLAANTAHSVVNSAGGVGAVSLAGCARELEHAARHGDLETARFQYEKIQELTENVLEFIKQTYSLPHRQTVQEGPVIPPPREELGILFTLAMGGDVLEIRKRAELLRTPNSEFAVFGEKIYGLSKKFMVEELQAFIGQYMKAHE